MRKAVNSRILIADHLEMFRRGTKIVVEGQPGLRVVAEADSGEDALTEARLTKPDIAIIPLSIPGLSGLDLARVLRDELPQTQVLIFTIFRSQAWVDEAMRAGAKGYVLQDDPDSDLLDAIHALSAGERYLSRSVA